ncbi:MAG: 50S ribosomal protein L11 methyltransferase [Thermodesulfobacteriota bacterium]
MTKGTRSKKAAPDLLALTLLWQSPEPEIASELLAAAFFECGVSSFQVLTPGETGLIDDGPYGRKLGDLENGLVAYIPDDGAALELRDEVHRVVSRLAENFPLAFSVSLEPLAHQNWQEKYKEFFHTKRIGQRIVIRPSWEDYSPCPGDVVLSLDPGMAFGTGSHPTTALCLALLEKHLPMGAAFLDVGTGSGILLIAGLLLSEGTAVGVDNDAEALCVARENILRNGIDPNRFRLACGDLTEMLDTDPFSLVVANIELSPVTRLLSLIGPTLKPGTRFICSGILAEKSAEVCTLLAYYNFRLEDQESAEGWWAACAKKER